jgi:hypothetical protein
MLTKIDTITQGSVEKYPRILRDIPETCAPQTAASGRLYVRVKLRVWPGRGAPIANAYRNEIVDALKKLDATYEAWMVSVDNETSEVPVAIGPFRLRVNRRSETGTC